MGVYTILASESLVRRNWGLGIGKLGIGLEYRVELE